MNMSSSLNKVILIGNLGRAVEVRYFGEGKPVANFSLATTVRRKNKTTGEFEDETQWHQVVLYGSQVEWARDKLTKGRTVMVEGSIKYGSYTNKEQQRVPKVQIVATHIEPFGASKKSPAAPDGQADGEQGSDQGEAPSAESQDPWLLEYSSDMK